MNESKNNTGQFSTAQNLVLNIQAEAKKIKALIIKIKKKNDKEN